MNMHLRLKTVRKGLLLIDVVLFITCTYLYMYAAYRKNKPPSSDRHLQPLMRKVNIPSGEPNPIPENSHLNETKNRQPQWNANVPIKTIMMDNVFEELKFDNQPGGAWKQGFDITYSMNQWEKEPLEVFLVPHSHQDPGWIYTFDQYFNDKTCVGLDATLDILNRHPEARFIYAEISYFSKWVDTLSPPKKDLVRRLLHNGQLEIVSGGWVMTDEATASYYAMIDQMIEGHHWLWENFGYRPNVSWSIDPFGQSTSMAYLVRKMGFTGMVIGRVHYEIKKYMALRKALEFHWRQSWDREAQPQIPCHMLAFYAYDVPHTCGPDPAVCCQFDFWRLRKSPCPWKKQPQAINSRNVAERAALLADQYRKKATLYNQRGVLLVPLGDDFRYLSTREWELQLTNYNKLIQYFDTRPELRIKLRFATLSEYFQAFYRKHGFEPRAAIPTAYPTQLDLTVFTGDLFSYADRDQDYWTGYFTSRPIEKLITRVLESELRASEILYTYAGHTINSSPHRILLDETISALENRLTEARRSLSLFQHHDGVTGTAKSHVVADYNQRLLTALSHCRVVSAVSALVLLLTTQHPGVNSSNRSLSTQQVSELIREANSALSSSQGVAPLRSIEDIFSSTEAPTPHEVELEANGFPLPIILFNPLPQSRVTIATIDLRGTHKSLDVNVAPLPIAQMKSHTPDEPVTIQVELPGTGPEPTTRIRIGPVHLPPLSITRLVVQPMEKPLERSVLVSTEVSLPKSSDLFWLDSNNIRLGFDSRTGFLRYLVDTQLHLVLNVVIDFVVYQTNEKGKSNSGAYLFIPDLPEKVMELPTIPKVHLVRGPLVQEVTVYTPLVNHTIRLHKYPSNPSSVVEIENTVNLNKVDPQNIELAMRIRSNISNTNRAFFTDSNCFQIVRRQYYDKIPFQGNLYPMSCGVYIQSDSTAGTSTVPRLNLFSTYSHGVTSPNPGALYVWLDRRATKHDDRGLNEALKGIWTAQSNFRLLAELVSSKLLFQPGATPVLSVAASSVLTDLLRPIQRFVADQHIHEHMAHSVQLMPNFNFPTDYNLVSLKMFHHKTPLFKPFSDAYGVQVGMLLHRLPIGSEQQISSELHVADMFSRLNRTRAVRTSLTMVPDVSAHERLASVTVRPMELEAFLLFG